MMEDNSSAHSMITTIVFGKSARDNAVVENIIMNIILGNKCLSRETGNLMCCIINTPDLYRRPPTGSKENVFGLKPSSAQVFLLIMQNHVSSEEIAMFTNFKKKYGERIEDNTIVVLIESEEKVAPSKADPNIRRILDECGGRVCSFKQGMRPEELGDQLKAQYERMKLQQHGAENFYEDVDVPDESRDAQKHARHEPTEVKSGGVMPMGERKKMTIVLLGQTGSGKSATGNTILPKRPFESRASSTAITRECIIAEELVCGIKVRVVDTPDFFNKDLKSPEIHVQRCRELSQTEPVVYLLVMHMGRFTKGERKIVSKLQKTFGEDMVQKTIILFTGKEKLEGVNLHDYIKNSDPDLQELIKKISSRCHAFNNDDKSPQQVKDLIGMIMEMQHIKEHFPGSKKMEHKNCRLL